MKKVLVLSLGILSLNLFSQNDLQIFNLNNSLDNNIGLQQQHVRAVQTFASNVQLKRNTVKATDNTKDINKANTVKTKPVNTNKQVVRRRRVTNNTINVPVQTQQHLVIINVINVPPQMNPPAQLSNDDQVFQINVLENNFGNSFGNENIIVQQAVPVQEKQVGHAGGFLEGISLDINVSKINFKSRSVSKGSASLSSSYKLAHLKNKFLKMNRKMKGKLSFKKRLRIKVDNCFKW